MSSALKTRDSSVLEEFEIPEHLGGVVDDLKKEQLTLKKEIEAVKSQPVVRKQDESTKIFNLRQHQIELKIAELEEKKKRTEKELQDTLKQKNSTLHTDLKKLAQFILQESKKMGAISNLRNELQQVFESNLSDRKKNMGLIEEQNGQIRELGDLIRDTSKLIQGDFHFLTEDISKLQAEKQSETRKLAELKQEVAHHQGLSDEIIARKKDLRNIELQISEGQKDALAFAKLDDQLEKVRAEIHHLEEKKEHLERSTEKLKETEFLSEENHSRLLLRIKHLENMVSDKSISMKALDAEIQERKVNLEKIKEEEQKEQIAIVRSREELSVIKNEIAKLEGSRATYLILHEEAGRHFDEKKSFYQRESDSLEKLHHLRIAEFENSFEKKKAQWDEEFHKYSEERKATLKAELENMDKQDLEDIRHKKSDLLQDISRAMTTILSAEGFQSTEQKSHRARKEVEKSFELVFGKTRRWKFW